MKAQKKMCSLIFFIFFSLLFRTGLCFAQEHEGILLTGDPERVVVETDWLRFSYELAEGRWSLWNKDGEPIVENAYSSCEFCLTPKSRVIRKFNTLGSAVRSWRKKEVQDQLGRGIEVEISTRKNNCPELISCFNFYSKERFFTTKLRIVDLPSKYKNWHLKRVEPIRIQSPSGVLFVGINPSEHKILENGSNLYLDFMVNLLDAGKVPPFPACVFSHSSKSNGNNIIYDPKTRKSALAGFLSFDKAFGLIITDFDKKIAKNYSNHRLGFTKYIAQCVYRPPVVVASQKQGLSSELLYLDFFAKSPFEALEDYASAVGKWMGIKLWEKEVPSGWNSWGEYFREIDEEIILRNLDFAREHFYPFGMKFFQIDDGYSPFTGDWEPDPRKFPHGMKWLADRIRERGMEPHIWIAPFIADSRSKIYKEHPDWFLKKSGIASRLIVPSNMELLNLRNEEVKEHLREVINRYTKEWGYKWLKVDFAYEILASTQSGDFTKTVSEIYREGMKLIKEEAGEDVFVLGIGLISLNYGLVDGNRLGLDNMPAWNNEKTMFEFKPFKGKFDFYQGLVPTSRYIARRYWLNYKIWINHPDLIFFKNDRWKNWAEKPLDFNESLCFASLVGLSGGIVKIGDRMVDMAPREIEVIKKLLPVYKGTARPVDLFEKENPEIYDLKVKKGFENFDVIGVFNWGKNWVNSKEIEETERDIEVDFQKLGLDIHKSYLVYSFWDEEFIGRFKNGFKVSLAPRTVKVFALREFLSRPQFLSTNRHITQGGVEINEIRWDDVNRILSGLQDGVSGFEYHLAFYVPEGYFLKKAILNDKPVEPQIQGNIIKLIFTPAESREISWHLDFGLIP